MVLSKIASYPLAQKNKNVYQSTISWGDTLAEGKGQADHWNATSESWGKKAYFLKEKRMSQGKKSFMSHSNYSQPGEQKYENKMNDGKKPIKPHTSWVGTRPEVGWPQDLGQAHKITYLLEVGTARNQWATGCGESKQDHILPEVATRPEAG